MAVTHRVGQDGGPESLEHGLWRDAGGAEGLLHQGGALGGTHRLEDGRRVDAGEIVGHEIDGLVREPAEVLGVESGRRALVGTSGHLRLPPPG